MKNDVISKYCEVIQLHEHGIGLKHIALIVDLPKHSPNDWINGLKIPYSVRRYLGIKSGNRGYHFTNKDRQKMSLARKGKTYEEIYGVEEAERQRKLRSIESRERWAKPEFRGLKRKAWNKGLTKEDHPSLAKVAKERMGEGNPMFGAVPWNWKGGVSHEPYSAEFHKIKEEIRERDSFLCQICGVHQDELEYALHVHHIDEDKENNAQSNLVSLCRVCHLNLRYGNVQFGGG